MLIASAVPSISRGHVPLFFDVIPKWLFSSFPRTLATNSERVLSALWGKLAAEILMQQWETALDDLTKLKEIIDANTFAPILQQLQQRVWLMHWALFVFFEHENGRNAIIELFFQDR